MSEGIRIRLEGKEKTLATLRGILARTKNPKGLLDNIGASLVASTEHRFETGTGVDGSPWPESIRAQLTGGKTLVDTGRLRGSITHNATARMVEVGTNVIYAAIHQFGGDIVPKTAKALRFKVGGKWAMTKKVTIPARPFLGIDEDDEKEIILIGEDWLREAANG